MESTVQIDFKKIFHRLNSISFLLKCFAVILFYPQESMLDSSVFKLVQYYLCVDKQTTLYYQEVKINICVTTLFAVKHHLSIGLASELMVFVIVSNFLPSSIPVCVLLHEVFRQITISTHPLYVSPLNKPHKTSQF